MLLCYCVCLFCVVACLTVFVNCLVNTIRNGVWGVVAYFVVECYGLCLVCVVVLCWIDHVWSSKECVCFAL